MPCESSILIFCWQTCCHWQDRTLPNKCTDLDPHWPGSTSNHCAWYFAVGSISIEKAAPNPKRFQLLVTAFKCLHACMLCRYDSEMNDAPNAEKDHALWVFYFNFSAFFLPLAGRHSSKQMYGFKSSLARIYIKPLCLIFCRWQHFHWKKQHPIRRDFNFWSLHSSACSLHALPVWFRDEWCTECRQRSCLVSLLF